MMSGFSEEEQAHPSYFDQVAGTWSYYNPRRTGGIVSDQYYTITHDEKNIWIGTDQGLVRAEKSSHSFESYTHFEGIFGERVTALLPIENNLMIGTDVGISVFDLKRDSIYSANSRLTAGLLVFDFAIDGRTIYAATERGIYSLKWGGSTWKPLELKDPLLGGYVYDIQVADSSLYAVSDDGVVVVDLAPGSGTSIPNSRMPTCMSSSFMTGSFGWQEQAGFFDITSAPKTGTGTRRMMD
jgi:ligand-binding sensor domain-containing protein